MRVWIVCSIGEYSHIKCHGVFDNEASAQRCIVEYIGKEELEIFEREVQS